MTCTEVIKISLFMNLYVLTGISVNILQTVTLLFIDHHRTSVEVHTLFKIIGFHRSKQMAIAKSESGSKVKHMNKGQFAKKRVQVAYLGLLHIWVLAFGNKYYLRVCYNPQFIVTQSLRNLRLFFSFCGNPICVQPMTGPGHQELSSPPFLSFITFLKNNEKGNELPAISKI